MKNRCICDVITNRYSILSDSLQFDCIDVFMFAKTSGLCNIVPENVCLRSAAGFFFSFFIFAWLLGCVHAAWRTQHNIVFTFTQRSLSRFVRGPFRRQNNPKSIQFPVEVIVSTVSRHTRHNCMALPTSELDKIDELNAFTQQRNSSRHESSGFSIFVLFFG